MLSDVTEDYVRLYGENSEEHYGVILEQLLTVDDFSFKKLGKSRGQFRRTVRSAENIAEEIMKNPKKAPVLSTLR
ncbi:MAG: hypothetical protein ACJAVV_001541 [Alphaproteobacteria bacterium]|jgi:hypothetical protein